MRQALRDFLAQRFEPLLIVLLKRFRCFESSQEQPLGKIPLPLQKSLGNGLKAVHNSIRDPRQRRLMQENPRCHQVP